MNNAILDLFSTTKTATPSSVAVSTGPFRLDAAFYSADSVDAQATLSQSGARIEPLRDLAAVHCSGVRERAFVGRDFGIPLLAGSNLDVTCDEDLKFVSRVLTRNIALEALQTSDILISSAGTVGKADFVYRNHEGRLASQDVIRIRSKSDNPPPGYLFAFLTSPIARGLIVNQPAGSVIVRVYEENLELLGIPRLGTATESRIAKMITGSFAARADAKCLLEKADAVLHSCNCLPYLSDEPAARHSIGDQPEVFALACTRVAGGQASGTEYRLDAHFHNLTAQLAVANIKKCRSEVKTVADVTERVFFCNRFTRTFVDRDHGIPYLAGKNIVQIRPTDVAYLSSAQTDDLDQYRLQKGWILMTCSGTIGRTCMVWKNFEEFVGTHDLIRIVPETSRIDGGYLYAFLSSDYGKQQVLRYRHGSVIDHVTPEQVQRLLIPCPSRKEQATIGDKVREAYEKRAEAIRLEDEAQAILMKEITKAPRTKGV